MRPAMKKNQLPVLGLTLALLLTACTAPGQAEVAPEPTPTLTPVVVTETRPFALPCYPAGGFHPITGSNRLNLTLAPLLYRGLFALDSSFEPQKDLCESYSVSEDGLTWTFALTAANFSDGTPLTSAEAAASLELARQSSRYGGRLSGVARVTAGEGVVVLTLTRPNGALPALLDIPIVKETEDPQRPLGTGPYALTEGTEGLEFTAQREAVPLPTIPLRTIGASDDLVYAFDAREVSLVDTDLTGANALGFSGRFETTDYATTTFLYVGLNMESGPCQEVPVRQALARIFDREDLVERLLAGHARASALPVHPASSLYDSALASSLSCDPEAAQSLLTAAGWTLSEEGRLQKNRSGLSLRLVVNQDNTYKVRLADALGEALEEMGIAVTVDKLPWDDFVSALEKQDFDLYLAETNLTADFDLEPLLGAAGTLNYGGFRDAETAQLLETYHAAQGEDRTQAAARLYAWVAELSPIVSLCFKNGSLLTQWGQVSGASPTQRDVFYGLEGWTIAQF